MEKIQNIGIHGPNFLQNTYKHPLIYVCVCTQRQGRKNKMTAIGTYVFIEQ